MLKSSATISEASPHIARKRFGQNFLHDPAIIARIIAAIRPKPGDRIVEIGPGQAALTAPLIEKAGQITAIEIDRDLAFKLAERFPSNLLRIEVQDVLRIDFVALAQALGGKIRLVGNLPYNISSPILFQCLESAHVFEDQHVMLQKEVVDRMIACAGSKIYGRLSVMLQARYVLERCLVVPPGAFYPAPKVDSAVVRMVPLAPQEIRVQDWAIFSAVVMTAFSQRRKMLRNTLAAYGDAIDWTGLDIGPTQRAEEISVEAFILLANSLSDALGVDRQAGTSQPRRPG